MKSVFPAAMAVCFAVAVGLPSEARSMTAAACADRETVIERLARNYGETRRGIGLGANNALMELFASTDTGSWTITMTMPDGRTCLIASGEAFETLQPAGLPGGEEDA